MTNTDFGDYEVADAYDTAPPDREQVARRIQLLRVRRQGVLLEYDELDCDDQDDLNDLAGEVIAWLESHHPDERESFGVAVDLEDQIADPLLDWLIRQGAWR